MTILILNGFLQICAYQHPPMFVGHTFFSYRKKLPPFCCWSSRQLRLTFKITQHRADDVGSCNLTVEEMPVMTSPAEVDQFWNQVRDHLDG